MWDLKARVWDNSAPPVDADHDPARSPSEEDQEKHVRSSTPDATDTDDESLNKDVQDGVHQVEAVASVWSTRSLIVAYAM